MRNTRYLIIIDSLISCLNTTMEAYVVHRQIYGCIPSLHNQPE